MAFCNIIMGSRLIKDTQVLTAENNPFRTAALAYSIAVSNSIPQSV